MARRLVVASAVALVCVGQVQADPAPAAPSTARTCSPGGAPASDQSATTAAPLNIVPGAIVPVPQAEQASRAGPQVGKGAAAPSEPGPRPEHVRNRRG